MKSLYTLALFTILLVTRTFAQTAPTIASISSSQSLTQGQALSLSVSVNGTAPFTYAWQKGGVAIAGATASTFSIAQVATTDIGSYTVTVTNSVSSVTSSVILVDVQAATPPTFYYQQSAVSVTVGDTLSLGANVDGTSPMKFVWKKGGTVITGATEGSYTKSNVALADAGSYTVTVSNIAGTVTSSSIVVTVNALTAPVFNYSPSGGTINLGDYAYLQGSVVNSSGVTFQWYKDNVAITNANYAYYQATTAGSYTLKATNAAGSTTSVPAVVVVNPAVAPTSVSVTSGPITVTIGETLSLYASANGTNPITYQWKKDGIAIAGAVSSNFYKAGVSANDAGNYSVVATNSVGSLASSATAVSVTTAQLPIITYHPASLTVYPGDYVSLSVNATGTGPLTFVWKKNGVVVANSNSSYLQVGSPVASSDAGEYSVTVSNAQGSVTSQPATLTVLPAVAPVIVMQPASISVLQGQSLNFSVSATGRPAPSYQWKKDGVVITGATGSSYYAPNVASSDAGAYSVVVTNTAGAVTSVDATATVTAAGAPVIIGHPASGSILLNDYFNGLWVNVPNQTGCTFQWYRDGVLIPGATNYSYGINGAQPAHAGTYHVVVANAAGSVTSKDAVITVDLSSARPVITYVSGSQSVMGGGYAQPSINVAPRVTNYTVAWKKDGVVVPNATSLYMTLSPFDLTMEGTYTAEVTVGGTTYTSRSIDLTLLNKGLNPRITVQPVSLNIRAGDSASFSVQVEGETPFTYQWYKGGVLIPGATNNSYYIYNSTAATAGNYSVTVANRNGQPVTSSVASLAFTAAGNGGVPIIYVQPISQTLTVGVSSFNMGISLVNGTNLETFQWYKDGVAVPNATSASYAYYSAVTTEMAGRYKVVVTNSAGPTTSAEAIVVVTTRATGPVFSAQPSDQTGYIGSSVTFSATATSSSTVSYQWRKDGAALAGATGSSLTLNSLQSTDAGAYTVVATDSVGSTPSSVATLTILAATIPAITSQPVPQVSGLTGSVTFSVAATGTPDPTFQWRKNGVNIAAATSSTLSLKNLVAGDAATYSVVVTNPAGSVTSTGASLIVYDQLPFAPAFSGQPQSRTATPGEMVNLTVTVTGFPTPTLQWYKNGAVIDGATGSTLSLGAMTAAAAGQYYAVANNVIGSVQSTTATVTYAASPFAGTYFGTLSTGEGWALQVEDDGTGTFLGYMSAAGKIIFIDSVKVGPTGAFTFGQSVSASSARLRAKDQAIALDAPPSGRLFTGLVTGQITAGAVTGQVAGVTGSFVGKVVAPATTAVATSYSAVPLASGVGEVHAVVAPDGTLLLVAVDGAGVRGGMGTTTSSGAFTVTQPQFTYSGNLLPSTGAISGTYQPAGGGAVVIAPEPSTGLGLERLVNVSSRGQAGTGSKTMIVGFVITGSAPQDVLLRAVGPTLGSFGVKGYLVNPRLKIFKGSTAVLENDDWSASGSGADVTAAGNRVGAYALPAGSADAALIAHLDPGAYTAQVTTADNSTGIALMEVYDAALAGSNGSKVVNLSARGSVATGEDVLIIGFVISGSVPKKVLIRGLGPSLAPLGVSDALVNPMLRLFHGSTKLTENDDWSAGSDAPDIAAAATAVGAFSIASGTKDSALLVYLSPGVYSAQVSGVNNTTGVGLVEVYEVP